MVLQAVLAVLLLCSPVSLSPAAPAATTAQPFAEADADADADAEAGAGKTADADKSAMGAGTNVADATGSQRFARVLQAPGALTFHAVMFVIGAGGVAYETFLLIFLRSLGAGETLLGLTVAMQTFSELPFFSYSSVLLKRVGPRRLLCLAMVSYCVRSCLYAALHNPWLVLPIQLLHGVTFACAWIAGTECARQLAPPGLEATAQGVFFASYGGLGALAGYLVGGALYDAYGARTMFLAKAGAVLAALAVYMGCVVCRHQPRGAGGAEAVSDAKEPLLVGKSEK